MRDNMTNSEQLKWVIAETGRMMILPIQPVIRLAREVGEVMTDPIFTGIEQFIQKRRESRFLDRKLSELADDTFLDRVMATHEIPVSGDDTPVNVPVRVIARRLQLIQDIR